MTAAFPLALALTAISAAPPSNSPHYARDISPLIGKYCFRCHSSTKPKGGMALDRFKDDDAVRKNLAAWEKVGDNLRAGDMPPAGAKKPTALELEQINRWLDAVVYRSDCAGPKDPG